MFWNARPIVYDTAAASKNVNMTARLLIYSRAACTVQ